jgi:hypothetical protein
MGFRLPEKVTIWNILPFSNDGFGGVTWSAPIVADARIALQRDKITDAQGDNKMSKAVFYTSELSLVVGSKVLLSESALLIPPADSDDVIVLTQTPSGAGDLKKAWL